MIIFQLGDDSHIAGKDFTVADAVFFPQLAFLIRVGLRTTPRFPRLTAYYEMLKQRASIRATWPPYWTGTDDLISCLISDF